MRRTICKTYGKPTGRPDLYCNPQIPPPICANVSMVSAILLDTDQKAVLARLEDEVAVGASFDSHAEEYNPKCLRNTRVEILQQISEWAGNSSAEAVFRLNGMAGTGKSTISRTVARSFARENRLGASFFFKRGETDRGRIAKFFSTIAADLTRREPAIARHVKNAIDSDPAILRMAMQEQFDKLVLQPLSMIPSDSRKKEPILIIVDALDECDQEGDIKRLIYLFSGANSLQSVRLRIFLTSRPELPIRLGFTQIKGTYQYLILHEIPESVVEHDISAFLEHELGIIRDEYNASVPEHRRLATKWPGQSNIQSLLKMAIPLFIFAATVCRFVADRKCGDPDQQLKEVLRFRHMREVSQMEATYMPILNKLIDGLSEKRRDAILQEFRVIVGSIIILGSPLSTSALAQILGISREVIDARLDLLHSVLSVPPSAEAPVRLLHLSFRDFLLDPKKREKNQFGIDEKQAHGTMAMNCLHIMGCLRQDICSVKAPDTYRSDIDPREIDTRLPPQVRYACLYWVYHARGAGDHAPDCERVYFFLTRYFLYWVEALSLIGRAWETLHLIKALQSLYKVREPP